MERVRDKRNRKIIRREDIHVYKYRINRKRESSDYVMREITGSLLNKYGIYVFGRKKRGYIKSVYI